MRQRSKLSSRFKYVSKFEGPMAISARVSTVGECRCVDADINGDVCLATSLEQWHPQTALSFVTDFFID